MSFGSWLDAELRRRKVSHRVLALRSGLDHSTVSRIISRDRDPNLDTLRRIAMALDVTFTITGDGLTVSDR